MHCQALIKQHQKLAAVVLQQYQAVLKKLEEDQEFMEGVMILAQKERVGVELKRFEDICRGGNAISLENLWVLFTRTVWTGDFVLQDELVHFPFAKKHSK